MICAEVGLNHKGDIRYSDYYVNSLINSDIDAITYQVREPDFYTHPEYKNLNLPLSHYRDISRRCRAAGKLFGIALASPGLLSEFENIDVDFYKVLSWDILNFSFIDLLLNTKKPVFVSTGMSPLSEIDLFNNKYHNASKSLTLIHTQLSFDEKDVNLKALRTLQDRYPYKVAFGNHCSNPKVVYVSLGFEPSDIFIYVKGSSAESHIDEKHSIPLYEINNFLSDLEKLKMSLGSPDKVKLEKKDPYLIQN